MPTVTEAKKRFQGMSSNEHVAIAIWCEDDVLGRAKEKGIKCSREQARDILDKMDNKQDCSIGITWDTIDCYLWDLKEASNGLLAETT